MSEQISRRYLPPGYVPAALVDRQAGILQTHQRQAARMALLSGIVGVLGDLSGDQNSDVGALRSAVECRDAAGCLKAIGSSAEAGLSRRRDHTLTGRVEPLVVGLVRKLRRDPQSDLPPFPGTVGVRIRS